MPVAGGRRSQGVTTDDGEYKLTYIRDIEGGAVGTNTVQISKMLTHDVKSDVVPAKYNRDSDLKREVKPGDNRIDFELTSK